LAKKVCAIDPPKIHCYTAYIRSLQKCIKTINFRISLKRVPYDIARDTRIVLVFYTLDYSIVIVYNVHNKARGV